MTKFKVHVTEEIKTTYVIEAESASMAINTAKNHRRTPNIHRTLEQHYRTEIIREEQSHE